MTESLSLSIASQIVGDERLHKKARRAAVTAQRSPTRSEIQREQKGGATGLLS